MPGYRFDAHEVTRGLWMGSQPIVGPQMRRRGFDAIVFCAKEYQPPMDWYPATMCIYQPLDDADLTAGEALSSARLARSLSRLIRRRATVLVTCRQGRNRSGLVTALTLSELTGCSGSDAVNLVRARRHSPFGPVLSNQAFVEALSAIDSAAVRGVETNHQAAIARLAG